MNTEIGSSEYTGTVARKRVAAAVVFIDGGDRVLVCEPTYKQVWEAPGGAVEADESPRNAAVREVHEELGLYIEPGRLLVVDWVPPVEGRTEGLCFVFDGGCLSPEQIKAIRLPAEELRSWAWCTAEEVRERMRPVTAHRIEAAMEALVSGATLYLEYGHRIDFSNR